jgi:hypothetical protein
MSLEKDGDIRDARSRGSCLPGPPSSAGVRVGLLLLVLLVRLPSLFEPAWYSDEGFFTTIAWAMSRGVPLYAGAYDNQPPVIFWLFRMLQALGSIEHHSVVQLLATGLVAAATLLTFELSRRFLRPWASSFAAVLTGLTLSLPVLDGDLINVELAALPFFLGAFLLAFSRRAALIFSGGVLLGVALATRPSFAVDALVLAIPLLASGQRVRRLCLAAGGLALAAIGVVSALAAEGSLAAYLSVVVPADHAYLVWSNGGTYLPLVARLALLAAAAALGLRRATTAGGRLAALWLPAALAGASLTPREFSHYSQEAIAPIAFTVALAVERLRLGWLSIAPATLAVIVAAELALIFPAQETALLNRTPPPPPFEHNYSYADLPAYYANWSELVLGRQTTAAYAGHFPGSADHSEAAFLKGLPGSAHARLIVLGDRPWLYLEAGMLPGVRYIGINSAFARVPTAESEMTRAIESSCAEFVVFDTGSGDWRPALDAGGYVEVPGAPLRTYRSVRPSGSCA